MQWVDPMYVLYGFFDMHRENNGGVAYLIQIFLDLTYKFQTYINIINDVVHRMSTLCHLWIVRSLWKNLEPLRGSIIVTYVDTSLSNVFASLVPQFSNTLF